MEEMNDGILYICTIATDKTAGGKPVKKIKRKKKRAWYSELNCSISEYYAAKQSNVNIEKRVEILQDRSITNKNIIILDEEQYEVGRVFHGLNKEGIPITDISLGRVEEKYELK